jgi:hypothetical protein
VGAEVHLQTVAIQAVQLYKVQILQVELLPIMEMRAVRAALTVQAVVVQADLVPTHGLRDIAVVVHPLVVVRVLEFRSSVQRMQRAEVVGAVLERLQTVQREAVQDTMGVPVVDPVLYSSSISRNHSPPYFL